MNLKFTEFLRGANGGIEVNRLVGGAGGAVYIVSAPAFQAWELYQGSGFDVTAFCLAYGGGLATLVGGTAAGVAIKDRNVATSKVIEATGSKPSKPPAPAPKVQPALDDDDDKRPSYAR